VTRNYAVFAPAYLAANVELDITTSTTRPATAFYASGSGTKDLHFVYDIREGDYNEGDLDTVPTVEGRRALQPGFGGIVGYLRSSSSNPETDINYDSVPEPGAYNSLSASPGQARVIVDADAAIITDIEAPSRTYSPGDNLDIKVTWSEKIVPPKNCSGSHFMLWLDLANDRLATELGAPKYVPYGAQALPHNGSATRSLTFRYIVRVGDESEQLETACVPCASAVVETAALWANASCNPLTLATNRPASLILPLRSDENTLGKSSNVVVTSAMPKILKVDADSSDVQTAPLAAGDVLRVFVRYDAAVVVAGDVAFPATKPYLDEAPRLELTIGDGQDSPFRGHDRAHRLISARYAAGSGTNIIRFDCVVRAPLGTVRADYDTSFSLKGSMWRLSDRPVLKANTTLPARGGPMSLGGFGVGLFALSVNTRRPEALKASLSRQTGVHSHRRQTLDLIILRRWASPDTPPSITGGSFRVALGSILETDPCIQASNVSAASIQAALGATHGHLAPRVSEQPVRNGDNWRKRFVVETGAGGHASLSTEICVALRCDNIKGGLKRKDAEQTNETCAVVEANSDGAFIGGSSVDVDVDYFGYPLTGRGGLAGPLSGGGFMTRSEGSLFQTIDVGVDASSQMKGGAFQLLYGSARTGCI
jgi:hypothetical protein